MLKPYIVNIRCPRCADLVSIYGDGHCESDCTEVYDYRSVPPEVASDSHGKVKRCPCGLFLSLSKPIVDSNIRMNLKY
jgi:hypothetical protein